MVFQFLITKGIWTDCSSTVWYHLQEKYSKNWAILTSTIIFRKN